MVKGVYTMGDQCKDFMMESHALNNFGKRFLDRTDPRQIKAREGCSSEDRK